VDGGGGMGYAFQLSVFDKSIGVVEQNYNCLNTDARFPHLKHAGVDTCALRYGIVG
jgi:hypothetical protein